MKIRDRVQELRKVKASELRPNPKNWRTHPEAQADALRGILAEVGIADAMLARELEDGSLMLIDGHLRAETLNDETVPVLILDVNEEEADKLLLTLDPLASLAKTNSERLSELINGLELQSSAVNEMVEALAVQAGLIEEEWQGKDPEDLDDLKDYDPTQETVSVRVNHVLVGDKERVVEAVKNAVRPFGYDCEAF